jgi:hypothetical protein
VESIKEFTLLRTAVCAESGRAKFLFLFFEEKSVTIYGGLFHSSRILLPIFPENLFSEMGDYPNSGFFVMDRGCLSVFIDDFPIDSGYY